MRVDLAPEAEAELEDATAWYVDRGPELAERFVDEIVRVSALLVENPRAFAELETGVRRAVVHGFPYALIYAVEADRVWVLAVMHQKRQPGYWRGR